MPSYFATKCYIPEYTLLRPSFNDGVEFFSNFENANLKKAIRVNRLEYELLLGEDFNTEGHFHWYFFKTYSTLPAGTVVKFKIINMVKPTSLYTLGFKPFVFSIKKSQDQSTLHLNKYFIRN